MILFSVWCYAANERSICGEYSYVGSENETVDVAKKKAADYARRNAIEQEFGKAIDMRTSAVTADGKRIFGGYSESELNGEWITDTKEPEYSNIEVFDNLIKVSVSVCGKARSIKNAGIDFQVSLLRNGTEKRFEADDFLDGDELYVGFRTPESGYLTIYLVDWQQTVFRLFPYQNSEKGSEYMKADKDYVLFSAFHFDNPKMVDELVLTATGIAETNQLYFIFSPNKYSKATDNHNSDELPNELSYKEFTDWLHKCRMRDKEMEVLTKIITIKKKAL